MTRQRVRPVRHLATVVVCALGWALAVAVVAPATPAAAHGSLQDPKSRALTCHDEGAESPDSAACRAAIAVGGTQPIYDWSEVNQPNAAGRHREIIPDGQLCGAGREKYQGFDLPRADWPATTLPTSGQYTFTFLPTTMHRGTMELYVTRDGYDPTAPLRWSDLAAEPFALFDTDLTPDTYSITTDVPEGKSGRHLIYVIWQRSDSPEAFYSCSDVVFGADNAPPPPTNACGDPWSPVVAYVRDATVSHNGHAWRARFWTRGDEPSTGNAQFGPWADLGACPAVTTASIGTGPVRAAGPAVKHQG